MRSTNNYIDDAAGNRVKKHVDKPGEAIDETTYYVRDASGNTMAVYNQQEETVEGEQVLVTELIEQPIYGSDRLGQRTATIPVPITEEAEMSTTLKTWGFGLAGAKGAALATADMQADPLSFNLMESPLGAGNIRQVAIAEDQAGELQFSLAVLDEMNGASNVAVILDKNGHIMPGSSGLASTLQANADGAAIISQVPGSKNKYLLLTTGGEGNSAFVHHIDMLLPGNGTAGAPLGEVTSLNQPILEGAEFAPAVALVEDRRFAETRSNFFLLKAEADGTMNLVMKSYTPSGAESLMYLANFEGTANSAHMKFSLDGKHLAVITGNEKTKGWFEPSTDGNTLRFFPMAENYRLVGEPEVINLPEAEAINSMEFFLEPHLLSYSVSSPEMGHGIKIMVLPDNYIGAGAAGGYASMALGANDVCYMAETGSDHLKVAKISGEDTEQPLPEGYTLSSTLPLQPLRLYGYEAPPLYYARTLNQKQYELKDHLGNVRAVISDIKFTDTDGQLVVGLKAYHNYYPFGLEMPGRNVDGQYRYGFNGKEKDNSFGLTNYDYGFRIYNPAIARFLSVDPLTKSYPMLTPYQFASNRPVQAIDRDGLEAVVTIFKDFEDLGYQQTFRIFDDDKSFKQTLSILKVDYPNLPESGAVNVIIDKDGNFIEFQVIPELEINAFKDNWIVRKLKAGDDLVNSNKGDKLFKSINFGVDLKIGTPQLNISGKGGIYSTDPETAGAYTEISGNADLNTSNILKDPSKFAFTSELFVEFSSKTFLEEEAITLGTKERAKFLINFGIFKITTYSDGKTKVSVGTNVGKKDASIGSENKIIIRAKTEEIPL